jgi:hypothetical protein
MKNMQDKIYFCKFVDYCKAYLYMKKTLMLFLSAMILFTACSDEETVTNTEDRMILTFYKNAISDTTGTMNIVDSAIVDGVIKLSFDTGNGNVIDAGDSVYFYYIGAALNSTSISNYINTDNVFVTNIDAVAVQCQLQGMVGRGVEKGIAGKNHYIKGLDIGLTMMNDEEDALIFFPSQLAYGGKQIGNAPANSPVIFRILIVKIKKN